MFSDFNYCDFKNPNSDGGIMLEKVIIYVGFSNSVINKGYPTRFKLFKNKQKVSRFYWMPVGTTTVRANFHRAEVKART